MSSNQDRSEHVSIAMSDGIEQSDFIKPISRKFKSVMDEIKGQGTAGSLSPKTKPLIQRVPPVLRNMKADFKQCFEPRVVALGPLHHGNPKFERAEQSKFKIAAFFAVENNTTDDVLFGKVKAEIKGLRECYEQDEIEQYDDEELAWMLFIDGCAVLCAVHYFMEGQFEKLNTKPDLLVFAQLDLFLLENQIPYKVLRILIDSAVESEKWERSLTDFVTQNLVTNIQLPGDDTKGQHCGKQDYAHLLARLREELLVGDEKPTRSSMIGRFLLWCVDSLKHRKTFRSIKELKQSGIHVKPTKTCNLKNIFFSCNFMGELMMPRIMVDDSTASKFMNLIALEMCRDFNNDFAVTTYLSFLDSLIDTADDVKELRATGVLHNYLGCDEEVAALFNKMSRDLVPDQQAYARVNKNIHKYCNNPCTAWVAQGYYTHFSSPWSFIAFLGVLLGLLFTATQTYFALPSNREKPPPPPPSSWTP